MSPRINKTFQYFFSFELNDFIQLLLQFLFIYFFGVIFPCRFVRLCFEFLKLKVSEYVFYFILNESINYLQRTHINVVPI